MSSTSQSLRGRVQLPLFRFGKTGNLHGESSSQLVAPQTDTVKNTCAELWRLLPIDTNGFVDIHEYTELWSKINRILIPGISDGQAHQLAIAEATHDALSGDKISFGIFVQAMDELAQLLYATQQSEKTTASDHISTTTAKVVILQCIWYSLTELDSAEIHGKSQTVFPTLLAIPPDTQNLVSGKEIKSDTRMFPSRRLGSNEEILSHACIHLEYPAETNQDQQRNFSQHSQEMSSNSGKLSIPRVCFRYVSANPANVHFIHQLAQDHFPIKDSNQETCNTVHLTDMMQSFTTTSKSGCNEANTLSIGYISMDSLEQSSKSNIVSSFIRSPLSPNIYQTLLTVGSLRGFLHTSLDQSLPNERSENVAESSHTISTLEQIKPNEPIDQNEQFANIVYPTAPRIWIRSTTNQVEPTVLAKRLALSTGARYIEPMSLLSECVAFPAGWGALDVSLFYRQHQWKSLLDAKSSILDRSFHDSFKKEQEEVLVRLDNLNEELKSVETTEEADHLVQLIVDELEGVSQHEVWSGDDLFLIAIQACVVSGIEERRFFGNRLSTSGKQTSASKAKAKKRSKQMEATISKAIEKLSIPYDPENLNDLTSKQKKLVVSAWNETYSDDVKTKIRNTLRRIARLQATSAEEATVSDFQIQDPRTDMGCLVDYYLRTGQSVPQDIVHVLLRNAMIESVEAGTGYVLDNWTPDQEEFDKFMATIDKYFHPVSNTTQLTQSESTKQKSQIFSEPSNKLISSNIEPTTAELETALWMIEPSTSNPETCMAEDAYTREMQARLKSFEEASQQNSDNSTESLEEFEDVQEAGNYQVPELLDKSRLDEIDDSEKSEHESGMRLDFMRRRMEEARKIVANERSNEQNSTCRESNNTLEQIDSFDTDGSSANYNAISNDTKETVAPIQDSMNINDHVRPQSEEATSRKNVLPPRSVRIREDVNETREFESQRPSSSVSYGRRSREGHRQQKSTGESFNTTRSVHHDPLLPWIWQALDLEGPKHLLVEMSTDIVPTKIVEISDNTLNDIENNPTGDRLVVSNEENPSAQSNDSVNIRLNWSYSILDAPIGPCISHQGPVHGDPDSATAVATNDEQTLTNSASGYSSEHSMWSQDSQLSLFMRGLQPLHLTRATQILGRQSIDEHVQQLKETIPSCRQLLGGLMDLIGGLNSLFPSHEDLSAQSDSIQDNTSIYHPLFYMDISDYTLAMEKISSGTDTSLNSEASHHQAIQTSVTAEADTSAENESNDEENNSTANGEMDTEAEVEPPIFNIQNGRLGNILLTELLGNWLRLFAGITSRSVLKLQKESPRLGWHTFRPLTGIRTGPGAIYVLPRLSSMVGSGGLVAQGANLVEVDSDPSTADDLWMPETEEEGALQPSSVDQLASASMSFESIMDANLASPGITYAGLIPKAATINYMSGVTAPFAQLHALRYQVPTNTGIVALAPQLPQCKDSIKPSVVIDQCSKSDTANVLRLSESATVTEYLAFGLRYWSSTETPLPQDVFGVYPVVLQWLHGTLTTTSAVAHLQSSLSTCRTIEMPEELAYSFASRFEPLQDLGQGDIQFDLYQNENEDVVRHGAWSTVDTIIIQRMRYLLYGKVSLAQYDLHVEAALIKAQTSAYKRQDTAWPNLNEYQQSKSDGMIPTTLPAFVHDSVSTAFVTFNAWRQSLTGLLRSVAICQQWDSCVEWLHSQRALLHGQWVELLSNSDPKLVVASASLTQETPENATSNSNKTFPVLMPSKDIAAIHTSVCEAHSENMEPIWQAESIATSFDDSVESQDVEEMDDDNNDDSWRLDLTAFGFEPEQLEENLDALNVWKPREDNEDEMNEEDEFTDEDAREMAHEEVDGKKRHVQLIRSCLGVGCGGINGSIETNTDRVISILSTSSETLFVTYPTPEELADTYLESLNLSLEQQQQRHLLSSEDAIEDLIPEDFTTQLADVEGDMWQLEGEDTELSTTSSEEFKRFVKAVIGAGQQIKIEESLSAACQTSSMKSMVNWWRTIHTQSRLISSSVTFRRLSQFRLYCPVALVDEDKMVIGNTDFACQYHGVVYLFSTLETRDKFLLQPQKYVNTEAQLPSSFKIAMSSVSSSSMGIVSETLRDHEAINIENIDVGTMFKFDSSIPLGKLTHFDVNCLLQTVLGRKSDETITFSTENDELISFLRDRLHQATRSGSELSLRILVAMILALMSREKYTNMNQLDDSSSFNLPLICDSHRLSSIQKSIKSTLSSLDSQEHTRRNKALKSMNEKQMRKEQHTAEEARRWSAYQQENLEELVELWKYEESNEFDESMQRRLDRLNNRNLKHQQGILSNSGWYLSGIPCNPALWRIFLQTQEIIPNLVILLDPTRPWNSKQDTPDGSPALSSLSTQSIDPDTEFDLFNKLKSKTVTQEELRAFKTSVERTVNLLRHRYIQVRVICCKGLSYNQLQQFLPTMMDPFTTRSMPMALSAYKVDEDTDGPIVNSPPVLSSMCILNNTLLDKQNSSQSFSELGGFVEKLPIMIPAALNAPAQEELATSENAIRPISASSFEFVVQFLAGYDFYQTVFPQTLKVLKHKRQMQSKVSPQQYAAVDASRQAIIACSNESIFSSALVSPLNGCCAVYNYLVGDHGLSRGLQSIAVVGPQCSGITTSIIEMANHYTNLLRQQSNNCNQEKNLKNDQGDHTSISIPASPSLPIIGCIDVEHELTQLPQPTKKILDCIFTLFIEPRRKFSALLRVLRVRRVYTIFYERIETLRSRQATKKVREAAEEEYNSDDEPELADENTVIAEDPICASIDILLEALKNDAVVPSCIESMRILIDNQQDKIDEMLHDSYDTSSVPLKAQINSLTTYSTVSSLAECMGFSLAGHPLENNTGMSITQPDGTNDQTATTENDSISQKCSTWKNAVNMTTRMVLRARRLISRRYTHTRTRSIINPTLSDSYSSSSGPYTSKSVDEHTLRLEWAKDEISSVWLQRYMGQMEESLHKSSVMVSRHVERVQNAFRTVFGEKDLNHAGALLGNTSMILQNLESRQLLLRTDVAPKLPPYVVLQKPQDTSTKEELYRTDRLQKYRLARIQTEIQTRLLQDRVADMETMKTFTPNLNEIHDETESSDEFPIPTVDESHGTPWTTCLAPYVRPLQLQDYCTSIWTSMNQSESNASHNSDTFFGYGDIDLMTFIYRFGRVADCAQESVLNLIAKMEDTEVSQLTQNEDDTLEIQLAECMIQILPNVLQLGYDRAGSNIPKEKKRQMHGFIFVDVNRLVSQRVIRILHKLNCPLSHILPIQAVSGSLEEQASEILDEVSVASLVRNSLSTKITEYSKTAIKVANQTLHTSSHIALIRFLQEFSWMPESVEIFQTPIGKQLIRDYTQLLQAQRREALAIAQYKWALRQLYRAERKRSQRTDPNDWQERVERILENEKTLAEEAGMLNAFNYEDTNVSESELSLQVSSEEENANAQGELQEQRVEHAETVWNEIRERVTQEQEDLTGVLSTARQLNLSVTQPIWLTSPSQLYMGSKLRDIIQPLDMYASLKKLINTLTGLPMFTWIYHRAFGLPDLQSMAKPAYLDSPNMLLNSNVSGSFLSPNIATAMLFHGNAMVSTVGHLCPVALVMNETVVDAHSTVIPTGCLGAGIQCWYYGDTENVHGLHEIPLRSRQYPVLVGQRIYYCSSRTAATLFARNPWFFLEKLEAFSTYTSLPGASISSTMSLWNSSNIPAQLTSQISVPRICIIGPPGSGMSAISDGIRRTTGVVVVTSQRAIEATINILLLSEMSKENGLNSLSKHSLLGRIVHELQVPMTRLQKGNLVGPGMMSSTTMYECISFYVTHNYDCMARGFVVECTVPDLKEFTTFQQMLGALQFTKVIYMNQNLSGTMKDTDSTRFYLGLGTRPSMDEYNRFLQQGQLEEPEDVETTLPIDTSGWMQQTIQAATSLGDIDPLVEETELEEDADSQALSTPEEDDEVHTIMEIQDKEQYLTQEMISENEVNLDEYLDEASYHCIGGALHAFDPTFNLPVGSIISGNDAIPLPLKQFAEAEGVAEEDLHLHSKEIVDRIVASRCHLSTWQLCKASNVVSNQLVLGIWDEIPTVTVALHLYKQRLQDIQPQEQCGLWVQPNQLARSIVHLMSHQDPSWQLEQCSDGSGHPTSSIGQPLSTSYHRRVWAPRCAITGGHVSSKSPLDLQIYQRQCHDWTKAHTSILAQLLLEEGRTMVISTSQPSTWRHIGDVIRAETFSRMAYAVRLRNEQPAVIPSHEISPKRSILDYRLSHTSKLSFNIAFSGFCPVAWTQKHELIPSIQIGETAVRLVCLYQNRLFVFQDEASLRLFLETPDKFISSDQTLFAPESDGHGNTSIPRIIPYSIDTRTKSTPVALQGLCPVSLTESEKIESIQYGLAAFSIQYQGNMFQCSSPQAFLKFLFSPHRFATAQVPEKLPAKRSIHENAYQLPQSSQTSSRSMDLLSDTQVHPHPPGSVSNQSTSTTKKHKKSKLLPANELSENARGRSTTTTTSRPTMTIEQLTDLRAAPKLYGYLEQTVTSSLKSALLELESKYQGRIKHPRLDASRSLRIFLALHLQANNTKTDIQTLQRAKYRYGKFLEECGIPARLREMIGEPQSAAVRMVSKLRARNSATQDVSPHHDQEAKVASNSFMGYATSTTTSETKNQEDLPDAVWEKYGQILKFSPHTIWQRFAKGKDKQ